MTRYLSLAEFWILAEHVTGIGAATLIRASRVDLAVSALHAPQAAVQLAHLLTGSNASAEDGALRQGNGPVADQHAPRADQAAIGGD